MAKFKANPVITNALLVFSGVFIISFSAFNNPFSTYLIWTASGNFC